MLHVLYCVNKGAVSCDFWPEFSSEPLIDTLDKCRFFSCIHREIRILNNIKHSYWFISFFVVPSRESNSGLPCIKPTNLQYLWATSLYNSVLILSCYLEFLCLKILYVTLSTVSFTFFFHTMSFPLHFPAVLRFSPTFFLPFYGFLLHFPCRSPIFIFIFPQFSDFPLHFSAVLRFSSTFFLPFSNFPLHFSCLPAVLRFFSLHFSCHSPIFPSYLSPILLGACLSASMLK